MLNYFMLTKQSLRNSLFNRSFKLKQLWLGRNQLNNKDFASKTQQFCSNYQQQTTLDRLIGIDKSPKCQQIAPHLTKKCTFSFSYALDKQDAIQATQNVEEEVMKMKPETSNMLFFDHNKLQSMINLREIRNSVLDTAKLAKIVTNQGGVLSLNQIQPNSFKLILNKVFQVCRSNSYLSQGNFNEYADYPMTKLIEICLRFVELHNLTPQQQLYGKQSPLAHWKNLQYSIRKRMHNCALKDYMRVLYIVLQSYNSVYRFNPKFIESLISGVRKQVPLMQQLQVMQLFFVISQASRFGRSEWESTQKYSQTTRSLNQRIKSPFYEHHFLCALQDQILDKIVKKYQRKYVNTNLTMKEEDLFKILYWLKMIVGFYNRKNNKLQQEENNVKNRHVIGLVEVILQKYHKIQLNSNSTIQNIKRQNKYKETNTNHIQLLEKKSLQFKSFSELWEMMQTLSSVRKYLVSQHQVYSLSQGIRLQDKSSQLSLQQQLQIKCYELNSCIMRILSYENVKALIGKQVAALTEDVNFKQQPTSDKQQVFSFQIKQTLEDGQKFSTIAGDKYLSKALKVSQLMECMHEAHLFQINYSGEKFKQLRKDWYNQLLNRYKFNELLIKTQSIIKQRYLEQGRQIGIIPSLQQKQKILRLLQSQMKLLHDIFNQSRTDATSTDNKNQSLRSTTNQPNINDFYTTIYRPMINTYMGVLYGKSQRLVGGKNQSFQNKQLKSSKDIGFNAGLNLVETIRAETIHGLIDVQLFQVGINKNQQEIINGNQKSYYYKTQSNKELTRLQMSTNLINYAEMLSSSEQIYTFPSFPLILSYSQELLLPSSRFGLQTTQTIPTKYYIRQLQFQLQSYFKIVLQNWLKQNERNKNDGEHLNYQEQSLIRRVEYVVKQLLRRNQQAKMYLEANNSVYDLLVNDLKANTFAQSYQFRGITLPGNNQHIGKKHGHLLGSTDQSNQLTSLNKNMPKQQYLSAYQVPSSYQSFSKETILLGEFMMKCIGKQRRGYVKDEKILKLTKFFTQIKAFEQIKFGYPLTDFMLLPLFVYMPSKNFSQQQLRNSIQKGRDRETDQNYENEQDDSVMRPIILQFLTLQQINEATRTSQRLIFSMHRLSVGLVDIDEFLKLHTNERIQKLKQVIRQQIVQQQINKGRKHNMQSKYQRNQIGQLE